jgi:hypothetical protein
MTIPWLMNCAHDDSGWCLECVTELAEERNKLRDALEEVVCGWHDIDKRIRYVEVQIDKDEIRRIHRFLGKAPPEFK